MTKVLDHGFVELDEAMADDLCVVNSARVSFGKRSEWEYHTGVPESYGGGLVTTTMMEKRLPPGDDKLISYLMRNRHGTPFEHNAMRFRVKAPIFVFREWHRHRIASINEMSARYMELPGEWYIPEPENVRMRVGAPGKYTYEPVRIGLAKQYCFHLDEQCRDSYTLYKSYLDQQIAPEQARMFLHVNHYSEMYWTVNARSLMNFINLRNAPDAQWEIRQFAIEVENVFAGLMPVTHKAFLDNDRVAP